MGVVVLVVVVVAGAWIVRLFPGGSAEWVAVVMVVVVLPWRFVGDISFFVGVGVK